MKIDSHMHVNYNGFSERDLIAYLDEHEIEKCWLLSWEEVDPAVPHYYEHLPVEALMETYEKYPSRIVPFYAPDPNRPDSAERLLRWHKRGVQGCGELKVSINWDTPQLDSLLDCVSDLNIPLVFHMERGRDYFVSSGDSPMDRRLAQLFSSPRLGGIPRKAAELAAAILPPLKRKREEMRASFPGYMLDFATLATRLEAYPNINFVGHGPLFWAGIAADLGLPEAPYPTGPIEAPGLSVKLLEEHDNLFADLSGRSGFNALSRDRAFTKDLLTKHGHQLLFGTDNNNLGLRQLLDSLQLPQATLQKIYSENAAGLTGE